VRGEQKLKRTKLEKALPKKNREMGKGLKEKERAVLDSPALSSQ